jgi:hypothetical protein
MIGIKCEELAFHVFFLFCCHSTKDARPNWNMPYQRQPVELAQARDACMNMQAYMYARKHVHVLHTLAWFAGMIKYP